MTEETTKSSGSIFKDLGFEKHYIIDIKYKLCTEILSIIDDNILGDEEFFDHQIDKSQISLIKKGGGLNFSIEKLIDILYKLCFKVELSIVEKDA
jgi:predicted XRE-type DNA-binding protein